MNHLAHFHLARARDDWLVGALLGDYVKGPLRAQWPAGWEEGIRLHRQIDALSDRHPLRAQLAAALPPAWHRYAGIALDVCCDHWLSRQWPCWHDAPLPEFAARVYRVLGACAPALPLPAQRFAARLRDYDLLGAYRERDAVPAALRRIGARLQRDNPLRHAGADVAAAAAALQPAFAAFYGELQEALVARGFAVGAAPPARRPVNAGR